MKFDKLIILVKGDDGKIYEHAFYKNEVDDVLIRTNFLPDTAQEEITITIKRKTTQSIEYANYMKNSIFRIKS